MFCIFTIVANSENLTFRSRKRRKISILFLTGYNGIYTKVFIILKEDSEVAAIPSYRYGQRMGNICQLCAEMRIAVSLPC